MPLQPTTTLTVIFCLSILGSRFRSVFILTELVYTFCGQLFQKSYEMGFTEGLSGKNDSTLRHYRRSDPSSLTDSGETSSFGPERFQAAATMSGGLNVPDGNATS